MIMKRLFTEFIEEYEPAWTEDNILYRSISYNIHDKYVPLEIGIYELDNLYNSTELTYWEIFRTFPDHVYMKKLKNFRQAIRKDCK